MGRDDAHATSVVSSDLLGTVSVVCRAGTLKAGADGASVALGRDVQGLSPIWASDPIAQTLEECQMTLGEGPCMDAVATGLPVLVDDIRATRGAVLAWPAFVRDVAALDVRGVFAFPLQIGVIALGSLELYRCEPGRLTPPELTAALNAADVLSGVVLGVGARPDASDVVPHYRLVVHQAAGMITVQLDVPIDEAMTRLRARAYGEGRSINDVAAGVVDGSLRFSEEES